MSDQTEPQMTDEDIEAAVDAEFEGMSEEHEHETEMNSEDRGEELLDAIMQSVQDRIVEGLANKMFQRAVDEGKDAEVHHELAQGYESTGADMQEMRELLRANYHQNESIICAITGLVLLVRGH